MEIKFEKSVSNRDRNTFDLMIYVQYSPGF